MTMKAIVIGAMENVGKVLTRQLLCDDRYSCVHVFVEEPWNITHKKLIVHVVDFNQMNSWSSLIVGDIAYCCFLDSLRKRNIFGAHWSSQYKCVSLFANICLENKVKRFVLLSVRGINLKDRVVYRKTHKYVEGVIKKMSFTQTAIVRPSIIFDPYESSLGQRIGFLLLKIGRKIGLRNIKKPVSSVLVADSLRNSIVKEHISFVYVDHKTIVGY